MDPMHVMNRLGKGLKKGLGLEAHAKARVDPGAAQAMSHNNAERAKAELGGLATKAESGHRSIENDLCGEHSSLAHACKEDKNTATLQAATSTIPSTPEQFVRSHSPLRDTPRAKVAAATTTASLAKQSFQRPINPHSNLIAKGWIEHQCSSAKWGLVWKEVLASLVEGRKPGEKMTLWIQREATNSHTGKPELEILHQIPMNWLIDVEYVDNSMDHRFALKLSNVKNWVLFKCADKESAEDWVSVLCRVREISMKVQKVNKPMKNEAEKRDEMMVPPAEQIEAPKEPSSHCMTVSDVHAVELHAANDKGDMERQDMEAAASTIAASAQSDTTIEKSCHEEELGRKLETKAMKELLRRMAGESEQRRKGEEEEQAKKTQRIIQMAEEDMRRRKLVVEKRRKRAAGQEAAEQRCQQEEAQPEQWHDQEEQQDQRWKQCLLLQQQSQQNWQQREPNQQRPSYEPLGAGSRRDTASRLTTWTSSTPAPAPSWTGSTPTTTTVWKMRTEHSLQFHFDQHGGSGQRRWTGWQHDCNTQYSGSSLGSTTS